MLLAHATIPSSPADDQHNHHRQEAGRHAAFGHSSNAVPRPVTRRGTYQHRSEHVERQRAEIIEHREIQRTVIDSLPRTQEVATQQAWESALGLGAPGVDPRDR